MERRDDLTVRADLRVVDECFDEGTLARARAYVSDGAVLEVDWEPDGRSACGRVQGSRLRPYEVRVELVHLPNGRLDSVESVCSCPVTYNCKHGAAVVLSRLRVPWQQVAAPESRATPARASWETLFDAMLHVDGEAHVDDAHATFAVQFELVTTETATGTHTSARRAPDSPEHAAGTRARIRLRPVARGSSGNWVRSGVSWRTVDYLGTSWFRRSIPVSHIPVLKELRALAVLAVSHSSYSSYSSHSNEDVWLDEIASRRVWDLLGEAQRVGLPLVGAGRTAVPVTVHRAEAELFLDATATPDASGVVLQPRLSVGALDVPVLAGASLPIGTPPHGIAWWDGAARRSSAETPPLSFARLPDALTASLGALLRGTTIVVPHDARERFLDEIYPRIRHRIRVESSDGSVALPDLPDDALILTLCHLEDHRIELAWSTGVPGTASSDRLRDPARHPYAEPVRLALDEARRLALRHPTGHLLVRFGTLLEPETTLQGMNAVRFLSDVLPAIEAVPNLVVEHIGEPTEYREFTEEPSVLLTGVGGSERDWFDLAVEVRVGGEPVPFLDLFLALANGQTHMLLPSGTYFSLESAALRELAQLIDEARALHDTDAEHIRVSRYQASLWEDFERLGVTTSQADEWERSVRALATAADRTEHPPPDGLDAQLRPYQLIGYNWLAFLYDLGLGGILADDMGLGKTLQVLALVCHVRERALEENPFLVVAPTSVVGNWAAECRRFAPGLRVETVHATAARRATSLVDVAAGADIVITSYALFRLEYEDYEKLGWSGLVLDEAQFAKNTQSHAYRRAKALPVRFKLAVTGTPMENHLMELWALLSITAPGLLGGAERFGEYYRTPIERHGAEDRLALLRRRIQPLLLRRSKEQVAADLPKRQEQVVELELAPKHKKLYQTYLQRERQKVLGLLEDVQRNRFEILKSLTLLRQASLDVTLVDPARARIPSTKLDALMEMLEEIVADGHRVLVFSQFTRFLGLARARVNAAGIAHCYLDGRTRRRTAVLSEFRSGEVPVFLISLKAGGFGLNLTEADYCVLLDPWWNPATEAQAIDRVHRIGQTKNVMVYRLVAKGTIEEKVMAMKARKAALFTSVVGGGGFESGALTAADIRRLLD